MSWCPRGSRAFARLGTVVFVTLVLLASPAVGQSTDPAPTIDDVAYTGDGRATVSTSDLLLWDDASHRFTVTVSSPSRLDAEVCLLTHFAGHELGCEPVTVRANTTEMVTVNLTEWLPGTSGAVRFDVVLRPADAAEPLDRRVLDVTVLQADGDLDRDGLSDRREVRIGSDPRLSDTDGDGLSDRSEVLTYRTSPVHADSDADGLPDGEEIRTHQTNPVAADTDGDGLLDSRELEVGASPFISDSDGDGISDAVEVNTYGTNATTADTDVDGLDDGVELHTYQTNPMDSDTDGDGLSDSLEVFTYETDPGDPDTDDDGLFDGAEVTSYRTRPSVADTDGDGLEDGSEVLSYRTNPLNADTDSDGLPDGDEVERYETDPLVIDSDGDGTIDRREVVTPTPQEGSGLGPEMVGGIVLLLAAATAGLFWVNGRIPGRPTATAIGDRVRAAGRRLVAGRRPGESKTVTPTDSAPRASAPDVRRDVPPEFLSSEDRVLQLLDDHDGTIQQSLIVEETGWSKAKASRVLSGMEAEGQVTKIDVGRENIIAHPEYLPPGAKSPFES